MPEELGIRNQEMNGPANAAGVIPQADGPTGTVWGRAWPACSSYLDSGPDTRCAAAGWLRRASARPSIPNSQFLFAYCWQVPFGSGFGLSTTRR